MSVMYKNGVLKNKIFYFILALITLFKLAHKEIDRLIVKWQVTG